MLYKSPYKSSLIVPMGLFVTKEFTKKKKKKIPELVGFPIRSLSVLWINMQLV